MLNKDLTVYVFILFKFFYNISYKVHNTFLLLFVSFLKDTFTALNNAVQ